jgi:hypothetical protein
MGEKRSRSFYILAACFIAYVLFLYGPMFAIYILSFQGPDGGLTFPMNGASLVWFGKVFSGSGIVDIGAAFKRSLKLGLVVSDGPDFGRSRNGIPQAVSRCDVPVLCRHSESDHAVDHHVARHRTRISAA